MDLILLIEFLMDSVDGYFSLTLKVLYLVAFSESTLSKNRIFSAVPFRRSKDRPITWIAGSPSQMTTEASWCKELLRNFLCCGHA